MTEESWTVPAAVNSICISILSHYTDSSGWEGADVWSKSEDLPSGYFFHCFRDKSMEENHLGEL